ncbi:MAG: TfoX/Sxy family protein [Saprospiraceae bacterium]|jgi:TfoX/Sxy family transcriptional regulator of competence genes
MAYNEHLGDRIRNVLVRKNYDFEEKKMMGGLCFMVDDKMCVGVVQDSLMVRTDPEIYNDLLERQGCRQMDFTGRPLKGFLFVDPEGIEQDQDLNSWIQLCLDFNPKAKSSKKKKK